MTGTRISEQAEILLVEDSPTDALITREALLRSGIKNVVNVIDDGAKAVDYLRHNARVGQKSRPGLIILDLNLPRMSGHEVLRFIKTDESLAPIPVVILTTSKADEDIARSYSLHANCYITKPMDFGRFAEIARSIAEFWFGVVTLPPLDS